jgi:ABC-type spermidine/putrescine transport system permease subunit I
LPFWTSYLLRAYAWMTVLQTDGLLNNALMKLHVIAQPLELLQTPLAVVLGLTYGFLPFATLPIYTRLEQLDRGLLEAAADLGASPFQVFRKVIWPLSLPGVIAGSLMTFVPALGDFVTPDLMGGPRQQMIGNLIEQQFLALFDWPMGSALSLSLMAIMITSVFAYQRFTGGEPESEAEGES